jgi:hypothetical protein
MDLRNLVTRDRDGRIRVLIPAAKTEIPDRYIVA